MDTQFKIYELMENPETCFVNKFDCSSQLDSRIIYAGSPFYGQPLANLDDSLNKVLLLDLNVVNFIRHNTNTYNISALFEWVGISGINEISPIFGLAEQQRTHGNPRYALKDYIQSLEKNYGRSAKEGELKEIQNVFQSHAAHINDSVEMLRDYLVLIKYIYHQKGSLENKIKDFSGIITHNNLPLFSFSFLVGCLFFYVQSSPNVFEKNIFNKVQKDMFVAENKNTEDLKLLNLASDIMNFMIPTEIFWQKNIDLYNFCYIASADSTICLILNEICIAKITVNNGKFLGHVGFRPSGKAFQSIAQLVNSHIPKPKGLGSQKAQEIISRKNNLRQVALSLRSMIL